MLFATFDAADEFLNGLGLVPTRLVIAGEIKFVEVHHDGKHSEESALPLKPEIIAQPNRECFETVRY
jgi:hypothetical protein